MFKRKDKSGPAGAKVDVGDAIATLDTDQLKAVGADVAQAGKKEGKKKFGYLKRMAMDKLDEKTTGKAVLSDAETARRAEGVQPLLDELKRGKEHALNVERALEKHLATALPAMEAIHELAGVCAGYTQETKAAAVLVTQICGNVCGQSKLSAMSINENVLGPVEQATQAINDAREAKEAYYEARQGHDRALAAFQSLQGKTETVKPEKLEKHQAALAAAKTKWEQATAAYNETEAAVKNATNAALHKKGLTDATVLRALIEAEKTEATEIEESFKPAEAEIAKARAGAEQFYQDCFDKKAKLCDALQYPVVGLATAAVAEAAAVAAQDEAASVLSPREAPAEEGEPPPQAEPAPAPAAAGAAALGGETRMVTIVKGPKGFGFSTDDSGVVTGSGGAAAEAGVPAGAKIVGVGGVAVGSKGEIIAQLRALGPEVTEVQFELQTSSAFGSADLQAI